MNNMPRTNTGKKYKDRQNNERRIVYWLRRHKEKLSRVLGKVMK
jgi:hypothetical protein